MVSVQTWFIIGLVALSWFQYTYPETANPLVGKAWDIVNNLWQSKVPNMGNNGADTSACSDTVEQVCGSNGVTYDNICKAALNDILEVEMGAC